MVRADLANLTLGSDALAGSVRWQAELFETRCATDLARQPAYHACVPLLENRTRGRSLFVMDRGQGQLAIERQPVREDFAHRAVPLLALPGFEGLCLSGARSAVLPADAAAARQARAVLRRAGLAAGDV